MQRLKELARNRFESLGAFSPSDEAFQYVPMRAFSSQSWHHAAELLTLQSPLPSGVLVLSLAEALLLHRAFLPKRIETALSIEKDPFVALNFARQEQGLFIYVPPHCDATSLQYQIGVAGAMNCPRIHLLMGKGSNLELNITADSGRDPHCINMVLEVHQEEGSCLKINRQIEQQMGQWHFGALRAHLKKDATLSVLSRIEGGCTRYSDRVTLAGEGARVELRGLATLHQGAEAHAHWTVEHVAPHTYSRQRFKTLLYDTAKASFEGKIRVEPDAQKIEAYQLNNNLLLDERAVINSKPNLEIFADDVKASHGVTIAQVDADALFYFKTRGISEPAAKQLLSRAFAEDLD